MFGYKRVNIAQNERGVRLRNGSFDTILDPGSYNVFDPFAQIDVQVCDLRVPEFDHPRIDTLVKDSRALLSRYFVIVELGEHEAGVVFKNGRLAGVLAPGKRQLYWRGPMEVRVERQDISRELVLWRARVARKACTVARSGGAARHGRGGVPGLFADSRTHLETRELERVAKISSA
jgi:hypothetical protein